MTLNGLDWQFDRSSDPSIFLILEYGCITLKGFVTVVFVMFLGV